MSGSSGIGQLLKGVIMGIVLILAIIGSMSMLEKNNSDKSAPANASSNTVNPNSSASNASPTSEIQAPEINIASQPSSPAPEPSTNASTQATTQTPDSFQPVLEGEKTEEEKQAEVIKYGILKLSSINPENKESLLADYIVFDNKNTKVAESNNSSSASYRLPVGTYRVITTLVKSSDATTRETAPIQSTKTITISAHKLSDEVFELEPPPTIGVLQVSAINAKTNKTMKANFIVQKENGETVASRQNVTNSLFKLKADSYKVTVKSGNNSDFRTIVVEPGESSTEVFKLQEVFLQGKVLVRIFEKISNKPLQANIEISNANGENIQALKAVSQTEIALVAGIYKIKVTGSREEYSKSVTVISGQSSEQIFKIDAPLSDNTATTNHSVQINEHVKISAVGETKTDEEKLDVTETNNQSNEPTQTSESFIKLFARNDSDQRPLKSNFYLQTPNGKHLAKKIYANSAKFKLKPGKYRITVRSKNRKNMVRNIQVSANQAITEVFSLQRDVPVSAPIKNKQSNTPPSVSATKKTSNTIPNGFLNVSMRPAKRTHFIIANKKGKKIVELTSVPSGNFKLDTGTYTVTAILNGQRRRQTIQVQQGKTSQLSFNASDFQKNTVAKPVVNPAIQKGGLRSQIVDNNGRPLRGNLTVKNLRGQIVARANNVTFGVFDLPAVPHTITVNYQGLSGSERVNITAGKTTVQTFTVSPNNAGAKPVPSQKPRDAKDILREKLKEELQRIF